MTNSWPKFFFEKFILSFISFPSSRDHVTLGVGLDKKVFFYSIIFSLQLKKLDIDIRCFIFSLIFDFDGFLKVFILCFLHNDIDGLTLNYMNNKIQANAIT